MPAALPKPAMTTFFQSRPTVASLASAASTKDRPRSSTSCSMSRSSFSKVLRSRRNQVPSSTSGAAALNSARPSPAGCWDQEMETRPAPRVAGRSLMRLFSACGSSPTQMMRLDGLLPEASRDTGSGPSGLVAATLWSVKRRLSHSVLSLARSSSSLLLPPAGLGAGADAKEAAMGRPSVPPFCSSSCSVGKMSTTCELSVLSAARLKASLMASSPTL
mmetsp:Transcript_96085/g.271691  ORF Transcript_96085/g.271691 Transcript_96085/m.271691 type:complete len:218 (-) Transcript_96085:1293-1946(-)